MALLCKDICRDLLPPQEYFDYGLWMPSDKYRPQTEESSGPGSDSDSDSPAAGEAAAAARAEAEAKKKAEEAMKAVQSEFSKKFEAVSGGGKTVTPEQAGDLARLLGFAPSQNEVQALKTAKGGNVSQADVSEWLKSVAHPDDEPDSLIKFFQYYDTKGTGTLTRQQISNLLRSYGEPLTDAEVNGILSEFGMSGDNINYRDFVEKLLQK